MERNDLTPIDDVTPGQWRKIATAKTKDAAVDACMDAGVDFRAAGLFAMVVDWAKKLTTQIDGAANVRSDIHTAETELKYVRECRATDHKALMATAGELESRLRELRTVDANVHAASGQLSGLKQRFPELLGIEPLTNPDGTKRFPPVCDALPPAVWDELQRLGLPLFKYAPWQAFEPVALPPKPRKRIEAGVSQ